MKFTAKKCFLACVSLFASFFLVKAQTRLTYLYAGELRDSVLLKRAITLYKKEFGKEPNMSDSSTRRLFSFFNQGDSVIRNQIERTDTLIVERKKDSIFFNSPYSSVKERTGYAYLSLNTNEVIYVFRSMLEENIKRDTSQLMQTQYQYLIEETSTDSLVLGYKCKKIKVKEFAVKTHNEVEIRSFIIWATKEISPTVPIYAVLWLHKKVLQDFTPLYIEEMTSQPYLSKLFINVISVKFH